MNILHIDSSLFHDGSVSRELSARIVAQLKRHHVHAEMTYRDVANNPPPHLTAELLASGDAKTETSLASRRILQEFLAADVVVIGAPMYNFSIPSPLKAWLDHTLKAGVTFRYTENGPIGLAGNKRVIVASTRGGIYSTGPAVATDQQESLLSSAFALMGIERIEFVRAEGLAMGPEHRERAMQEAAGAIHRFRPDAGCRMKIHHMRRAS
jgi:FMN-dependent NADH-azoreductase